MFVGFVIIKSYYFFFENSLLWRTMQTTDSSVFSCVRCLPVGAFTDISTGSIR